MLKSLTILLLSLFLHPVHVSMSSLSNDPEGDGYLMTVRIYNDDLAIDLIRLYGVQEISTEDHYLKYTGPDDFLEKYVNEHLVIKINDKVTPGKYLGKEVEELETIINFKVPFKKKVKRVEIENRLLTGLYPDQVNLFIYKDNIAEKGLRFTSKYYNETITFD